MAEGFDAEWELSKENIQPLRRGRRISALQEALTQHQDGFSSAIIHQRQSFETEIRVYEGDDPLDVWDRYINWTEQTFPQGGKESNLTTLLERAVTKFTDEKKYHNDPRYVNLWIAFAKNCSEPLDIYQYMQAQEIGVLQASFYIAWSEEYEDQGNSRKADWVYQEGFKKFAEPQDKLMQFHKALQARVSRQVFMNVVKDEDSDEEPTQPERMTLASLKHRGKKKAIVPVNRTGTAVKSVSGGLKLQGAPVLGNATNSQFFIFDENKAPDEGPTDSKLESWGAPPTSSKSKENEKKPEKWCDVKLRQKNKFGHTVMAPPPPKPTFQPYVEESDQPPTMTPCKINPSVNTVLSARKPCKEETPLKRLQEHQQKETESEKCQVKSMYCKELLLSGATEFCFEELRAERYRQKMSQEVKGQRSEAVATNVN